MDTNKPTPVSDSSNIARHRPRRRFTAADRQEHLAAWARSGLSAQAYGQPHGLLPSQIYLWRKQQRTRSRKRQRAASPATDVSPKHRFLALRLTGDRGPDCAAVAGTSTQKQGHPLALPSALQVTLRQNGCECIVGGAADQAQLLALLRGIREEVLGV